MPELSKELRAFLTEWLAWADAGAPEHPTFWDGAGLCSNLRWFTDDYATRLELSALFDGDITPFGHESYFGTYRRRQSKDPKRLAWVRGVLAENEED